MVQIPMCDYPAAQKRPCNAVNTANDIEAALYDLLGLESISIPPSIHDESADDSPFGAKEKIN
jgi:hypothetical protein